MWKEDGPLLCRYLPKVPSVQAKLLQRCALPPRSVAGLLICIWLTTGTSMLFPCITMPCSGASPDSEADMGSCFLQVVHEKTGRRCSKLRPYIVRRRYGAPPSTSPRLICTSCVDIQGQIAWLSLERHSDRAGVGRCGICSSC